MRTLTPKDFTFLWGRRKKYNGERRPDGRQRSHAFSYRRRPYGSGGEGYISAELGRSIYPVIEMKKNQTSAIYLSILNDKSDMELAISDMDVVKYIFPEFLERNMSLLSLSKAIALDGNLERETIEFAAKKFQNIPLFFDPVSTAKAVRAKDVIGSFTCVKPNIMEAEVLSGIKITCEEDLKTAGQWFIDKGVEKVFITLNKDGVYFKDKDEEGFIRPGQVKVNRHRRRRQFFRSNPDGYGFGNERKRYCQIWHGRRADNDGKQPRRKRKYE